MRGMEGNTKLKLAACAAVAIAVAGGGVAIGATQLGSPKEESATVVADAAKQLGIDPRKLSDALENALEERVDASVAAGQLTREQGEALKQRIESGEYPLFLPAALREGLHFGFGFGSGLKPGGSLFEAKLDGAADYLGLTEAQLLDELQDGKTLAEVAKAHGKTAAGLIQAMYDSAKQQLDQAVKDGKLTQSQADKIASDLKARITDLVNSEMFARITGFGHDLMKPFLAGVDAAAAYLGITEAQLREELEGGKTLAEVAKAHGKSADGLVQALYDSQKKQLDEAVADGKLTRSQADAILANLKDKLTALVNGKLPRFDRFHLPGPPPGFHGFGVPRFHDDEAQPAFRSPSI
jgi:polyhydroxyalkanoate synthesis regulator phasin